MDRLEAQLRALTPGIDITRVSQGAEALVYLTDTHPFLPAEQTKYGLIIKYRPPKPYRHPTLDAQLTKHRTLAEARILQKLNSLDVNAPKLVFVDPRNGLIWMERVDGDSLKAWIWAIEAGQTTQEEKDQATSEGKTVEDDSLRPNIYKTLLTVGAQIATLHLSDIVHGDLTTSNIMLRRDLSPVLIDFGLGSHSAMPEDKAVDLYVLERAVLSTHPIHSDKYIGWLLEGYKTEHERQGRKAQARLKEVIKRLEDVRMRGRKRSMVG